MTDRTATQRDGCRRATGRRSVLAATGGACVGLLGGCLGGGASGDEPTGGSGSNTDWRTTELTTVRGGESFTIAGLDGPVVVESFAVWCPKCERQADQVAQLGDDVTAIGLNTDPNEDAARVRRYASDHGYDWRFAVAPAALTAALVDEFGPTVTNAPSTPLVVVCDGGAASLLAGQIRSTAEIEATAADC